MKKNLLPSLALFAAFGATAFAAAIQEGVPVKLGPKAFADGDAIRIDSVTSTSPHLEQGDTITVTGRYRLDSRASASLQLLLTQIEGDGWEETEAAQVVEAKSGWHPFEATITVKHRGFLHLTYYDLETGKPFGGVYFGTERQMAQTSERISVAHYTEGD